MTEAGVRRYGFHGLSYAYIASVLSHYDPGLASGRVVVAHLGNGASLCALNNGASVATTMGFSALDGAAHGHAVRHDRRWRRLLHAAGDEAQP
jgi:acetate kinase